EPHASLFLDGLGAVDVESLARSLDEQKGRLVRAKGVIQGLNGQWHDLQLSGNRVDLRPRPATRPPPEHPALVLIAAGPEATHALTMAEASLRTAARS